MTDLIMNHLRKGYGPKWSFIVFSLLLIASTRAFFPNRLSSIIGKNTLTHQDITEIGILRAVAGYFEDNPRDGSTLTPGQLTDMEGITTMKLFNLYYGDDVTGSPLQEAIDWIVTVINLVYKEQSEEAIWHFNGETIKEANTLMIDLREHIIDVLSKDNANFDLARELTGQFLHILQMFYSNTNWVEMFGADAYYTLGIRDKPLFAQALPDMMTCQSCEDSADTSCNDTLILNGAVITSGYRSGQDVEKPYRDPDSSNLGKCSHGGPFDQSGVTVAALGGINKDSMRSSLSPHYYLHQAAAQAAINHTTFFFNDKEYGLRGVIGDDKYKQFLQLKSGKSLAFTLDYTGSMSDDIEAVKKQIVKITQRFHLTVHEPSNYIVVLFNDPASLTKIFQSEDAEETLDFIQNITVSGGGDCPEYAMDGIEKALQVCSPNSQMNIFTDAPAKDGDKFPFIMKLAIQKNVQLNFFLTQGCERRRRDITNRNANSRLPSTRKKRSTGKEVLYRALAVGTGGSVYITSKADISEVANVIQETITASVTILKRNVPSPESSNISIHVDKTVRQMTIKISGSGTLQEAIYNPSGDIQSTAVNVTDLGGTKLIKLDAPTSGVWELRRLGTSPWTVDVTAQSSLDISSTFVQIDVNTGFEYEIIGRPIAGENATVVLFVPSKSLISNVDMIQLLDSDGEEFARYEDITVIESRGDTALYRIMFPLSSQAFQVAVSGIDTEGNRYTRLQKKKIVPVAIQLYIPPLKETLYVNESLAISFMVVNKGEAASDITVNISDDKGFAELPQYHQYTLDPNQNASGQFSLLSGQVSGVITTVTISANAGSPTNDSSQFIVRRISTKQRVIRPVDNTPPFCNVTSKTGSCDIKKIDSCTCSKHTWTATVDIGDEGFGLYQIASSVKAGSLSYDPFTVGLTINNGTVKATIESDCCNLLTYITVVDMASNTGQCVFDLAPGLNTSLPECKPTEPTQPVDNTPPFCNVTSKTGSCDVKKMDSCTCSKHTWSATVDIGDEGFGLYQIASSVKAGSLSYDPFAVGLTINNGTVKATIK